MKRLILFAFILPAVAASVPAQGAERYKFVTHKKLLYRVDSESGETKLVLPSTAVGRNAKGGDRRTVVMGENDYWKTFNRSLGGGARES